MNTGDFCLGFCRFAGWPAANIVADSLKTGKTCFISRQADSSSQKITSEYIAFNNQVRVG
jgi:hypothetical protein